MFKSAKGKAGKLAGSIGDYFSGTETWDFPDKQNTAQPQMPEIPQYDIPSVISKDNHSTFIEQAKLAGVSPNEFGKIARREQGANTLPHQAETYGLMDPTDKGVMQVNKMHDELVKRRFREDFGREYDYKNPVDSMIAARMVLEENRRQLEQMKINKSFEGDYSEADLIDTYNTGATGWVNARAGDPDAMSRLQRYQNAGQQ